MSGIFIQAASQISIQEPLCNKWFTLPIMYEQNMVGAIDQNYKEFIEPNVARRIGKILKRSIVTARCALLDAALTMPDAILYGTGLGCIESTEKFMSPMLRNGEEFLQPTHFMLSTHNTISSQIAVTLKCHGYNNTHVQDGVSFESALLDAQMNFELGNIRSALVGVNDELTPDYFLLLDKINYWKKEPVTQKSLVDAITAGSFSGEVSVSFAIQSTKTDLSICEINSVELMHRPTNQRLADCLNEMLNRNGLKLNDIDAVVIGKNGDKDNDAVYRQASEFLFPNIPQVWYKHIFGESYSASGMAMYVAATCLQNAQIPDFLLLNSNRPIQNPRHLLLYNHFQNRDHSFILLSSC